MSISQIILIILLCFVTFCFGDVCERSESCTTMDGMEGKVKPASECKYFKSLGRVMQRKIRPCSFEGRVSLICCASSFESDMRFEFSFVTPKIRKSELACKNFGSKPDDENSSELTIRVINGKMSDVGEFPHFAALGYQTDEDDDITFSCGGALISERFVITAAHCCRRTNLPVLTRLGRTALDIDNPDDTSPYLDINIKAVYPYTKYRASRKHDDIALVELVEDVKFTHNIWPACLQLENTLEENKLIIAGFGRDNLTDKRSRSKWLMKAFVSEIPLEECKAEYEGMYKDTSRLGLFDGIKNDLICAKNRRIHVDTCQGDSGSALQLLKKGVYYVFGITSFGVSCNSSLPSFYTRVPNYIDWIEKIVWP